MRLALWIYMLVYVLLPFEEFRRGFKMMEPVKSWIYWSATFLFDAIMHCCAMGLLMVEHFVIDERKMLYIVELGKYIIYDLFVGSFDFSRVRQWNIFSVKLTNTYCVLINEWTHIREFNFYNKINISFYRTAYLYAIFVMFGLTHILLLYVMSQTMNSKVALIICLIIMNVMFGKHYQIVSIFFF